MNPRWAWAGLVGERGDVILTGLLRTVAGLLVFGLLIFEVGAVGINRVQVDDLGRDAARAAATAWRDQRSEAALRQAALERLAGQGAVTLDAAGVSQGVVHVTVSRPAGVLVADQIPPLRPYLTATVTKTAVPGP